jgi:hypothetical protein
MLPDHHYIPVMTVLSLPHMLWLWRVDDSALVGRITDSIQCQRKFSLLTGLTGPGRLNDFGRW